MLMFDNACKIALKYFSNKYNSTGFCRIRDIGKAWLFNAGDEKHEVVYGRHGITVDKDNGQIDIFYLPDDKNFKLLKSAVDVEIPKKYVV